MADDCNTQKEPLEGTKEPIAERDIDEIHSFVPGIFYKLKWKRNDE